MTESRISASVAGVRGLIIHLKGEGYLFLVLKKGKFQSSVSFPFAIFDLKYIYDNNPVLNSGLSLMVFPWSSTGGLMSYTARIQAAMEYNELSLKYLPGHILKKFFLMSEY